MRAITQILKFWEKNSGFNPLFRGKGPKWVEKPWTIYKEEIDDRGRFKIKKEVPKGPT